MTKSGPYICIMTLHSILSFTHCSETSHAGISLLPKVTITPSIQHNFGLPSAHLPLTAIVNTLLATRSPHVFKPSKQVKVPEVVWWWLLLRNHHSCLGSQFDSEQCRGQFVTPLPCFPQLRCNSLTFRTPVLLHLHLDLETYGGVDTLSVFPLFLKMVEKYYCSKIKHNFRGLLRLRIVQRSANATSIPKRVPSPDRENYRLISITSILSKVYEKLVSHKLSCFCEKYVFLPAAQFAYRKCHCCSDAL